jgi:hypothetical protein
MGGVMKKIGVLLLLVLLAAVPLSAANWPEHPELKAVRATTSPVVDGDLSDAAWQSAPEFTDFTQHDPDDGKPPTMLTSVRIVYDDKAIYFGAKMTDPQPPTSLLVRRDTFTVTDFISINLDPGHDRLSGSAFTITPQNVQIDSVLYNDIGEDGSWDGVWDSATRVVPDGWIAEVRIPYSQLRFPDKPVHVWGLNITRRTVRNNEWVRIVNTMKGGTGFVSHFADITGIEGIHRGRPLELVPYGVARNDVHSKLNEPNPLVDRQEQQYDGGLDVKYALNSDLTLTGTINPDFGQVEVDPAVVNLSDFETFYPEKRPFFTEGVNIFRFDDTPAPSHFNFINPPRIFYSRRIGRNPQVRPDGDAVDLPSTTTILGAAKITGKLPGGWSIGVLDALTDSEDARFIKKGEFDRQQAEPMTNYFISRATKQLGDRSRVGIIATAVDRRLPDELSMLRKDAYNVGVDGYTRSADKSWVYEGSIFGSRVSGSALSIDLTQRASSHYYQRPDAGHVTYDPLRTSLDGWGGRAMVSKATGKWRPIVQVHAFSPGYETNDAGFMQRTDLVSSIAIMQYVNQDVTKRVREKNLWFGAWQNSNFNGDLLERGVFADHFATLRNYWDYRANLFVWTDAYSDRLTRGGPLVAIPNGWASDMSLSSDSRKRFTVGFSGHIEGSGDDSYSRTAGFDISARPMSNLQLTVSPYYTRAYDYKQYVTAFTDPTATLTYGQRYVFAELDQHSFEIGTRADWTLRPNLSFQLYLQPFIASGDYHDPHSLVAARQDEYEPYEHEVPNRDFNFRSVRGSAVVRWEFRPGSAMYVVWNENRSDVQPIGDFRFGRDLRAIPNAPSQDVFLVKVSYWLPL